MLLWLWLWRRLEAAALIQPLACEFPYTMGVALKKQKKNFFIFKNFFNATEAVNNRLDQAEGSVK